jgi:hypothetical protein
MLPRGPYTLLSRAAALSPPFSSSMRDAQSPAPVHTSTWAE